jgi:assimilatory nitrate reductase catalytic subunit
MHWTDAYAPAGRANPLVGAAMDAISGQPEFKHTPARIAAYRETWRGFFIGRTALAAPKDVDLVWRRTPAEACHLHEFAGRGDDAEQKMVSAALSGSSRPARQLVQFEDKAAGALRQAAIVDGRLEWVLFMTAGKSLPPRDWLISLFSERGVSEAARLSLLAGRPLGLQVETGPVICACLKVGLAAINRAIIGGGASVDAVGQVTGAGTNCGSCRPEIQRLIGQSMAIVRDREVENAA